MKAAQAHDKSTRGVLRPGASRCRSLLLRLRLGPREWPRCARTPRGRTAGFFMPGRRPLWVKPGAFFEVACPLAPGVDIGPPKRSIGQAATFRFRPLTRHFARMLVFSTKPIHFSVSALMKAANASGVLWAAGSRRAFFRV